MKITQKNVSISSNCVKDFALNFVKVKDFEHLIMSQTHGMFDKTVNTKLCGQ